MPQDLKKKFKRIFFPFVFLVLFEILSQYFNNDGSHGLKKYVQLFAEKVFREKLMN